MLKSIELLKQINLEKGKPLLWFRDDDLLTDSHNFRLILKIAKSGFPLLFGGVPYRMKFSDLELHFISSLPETVFFATHGFNHTNKSIGNTTPSEYPSNVSPEEAKKEFEYGYNKVSNLFPSRFLPMFIPPWNTLDKSHVNSIEEVGFNVISGSDKVNIELGASDLTLLHTHLDILNYNSNTHYPLKRNDELDKLLHQVLVQWLQNEDMSQPIGLLSHHTGMIEEDINRYISFVEQIIPYFEPFQIKKTLLSS